MQKKTFEGHDAVCLHGGSVGGFSGLQYPIRSLWSKDQCFHQYIFDGE